LKTAITSKESIKPFDGENVMVRMISIKQAIEETGLTESALRAGVADGTLPAIRVGRSARGKIMFEAGELSKALIELVRRNMKDSTKTTNHTDTLNCVITKDCEGKVIPFTHFKTVK
jgi:hypothetical protein